MQLILKNETLPPSKKPQKQAFRDDASKRATAHVLRQNLNIQLALDDSLSVDYEWWNERQNIAEI